MNSMHDALEHPYFAERGMISEIQGAGGEASRAISSPLYFSAAESGPVSRAPFAGEHTTEVLRELGRTEANIATLHADGAIEQSSPSSLADEAAP
jgi:crotonobetainyl-CoA:carnitine CoA-transferase CaiB-like acyl-CoA transferase